MSVLAGFAWALVGLFFVLILAGVFVFISQRDWSGEE